MILDKLLLKYKTKLKIYRQINNNLNKKQNKMKMHIIRIVNFSKQSLINMLNHYKIITKNLLIVSKFKVINIQII